MWTMGTETPVVSGCQIQEAILFHTVSPVDRQ